MAAVLLVLWVAPWPGAALAQAQRTPPQRQAMLDLAFVLGQSHALRQLCAGSGDQYWRMRMQGMLEAEAPDPAFDRRLKQSFNTGYAAAQTAFPACGPDSRHEEARVAARGQVLVRQLAR